MPTDQDVAQTSLGEQGSRQPPRAIAAPAPRAPPPPPPPGTGGAATGATTAANQAQQNNALQQNLSPTATNLSGRVKRSLSRVVGTNDTASANNIAFSGATLASGAFTATLGSNSFKFPLSASGVTSFGASASTASPNGTFSGDVFLSSDFQFLFLEGVETANSATRVVGFAGKPSGSVPTSGASYYALQNDFGLGSSIPFMRAIDVTGLTVPQAEGAADAAIYWDVSGSTTAQRSFGFRTISITGQGVNQKSAISIGSGAVLLDSQGRPFIRGGAIASARQNSSTLPTLTGSEVSSADDSLGNDFFGTKRSYFVLESADVSTNDVLVANNGAVRFEPGGSPQTTNFFPTVVAVPATSTLGTRSTRTMGGYLGGAYQTEVAGALSTTTMLFGLTNDSSDVEIRTNAAANKVRGTFKFTNAFGSGPTFQVVFGDRDVAAFGDNSTSTEESVFIDDNNIAAGDQDGGGSVTINSSPQNQSSVAFVSVSEATQFNSGFLPSGVSVCACKYLNWGFWGGRITNTGSSSEIIHMANYVAGEIAGFAAINALQGTATYTGHAIGTVFNGTQVYQAIGGLAATVNFDNPGSSAFNITNFDGANYTGTGLAVTSTGTRHKFVGSIAGSGRTGSYNGSFMSGGGDVAAEMGGQFKVDGGGYSAVGIFAAKK